MTTRTRLGHKIDWVLPLYPALLIFAAIITVEMKTEPTGQFVSSLILAMALCYVAMLYAINRLRVPLEAKPADNATVTESSRCDVTIPAVAVADAECAICRYTGQGCKPTNLRGCRDFELKGGAV